MYFIIIYGSINLYSLCSGNFVSENIGKKILREITVVQVKEKFYSESSSIVQIPFYFMQSHKLMMRIFAIIAVLIQSLKKLNIHLTLFL